MWCLDTPLFEQSFIMQVGEPMVKPNEAVIMLKRSPIVFRNVSCKI